MPSSTSSPPTSGAPSMETRVHHPRSGWHFRVSAPTAAVPKRNGEANDLFPEIGPQRPTRLHLCLEQRHGTRSKEALAFRHSFLQLLDELAQARVEVDLVARLRDDRFTHVVDERLPGVASALRALSDDLLSLLGRRLVLVQARAIRSLLVDDFRHVDGEGKRGFGDADVPSQVPSRLRRTGLPAG